MRRWQTMVMVAVVVTMLGAGGCGQSGRVEDAAPAGTPAGTAKTNPYVALVEALRSGQPSLQAYACEGFLDADQPPPVDEVRRLLVSGKPQVRLMAVTVLGAMQQTDLMADVRQCERDDYPVVRLAAAYAMAMLGRPTEMNALRDALASPDIVMRRTAAWLLGLMKDRTAVGMLKVKLDDPDAVVVLRAAEAMHRLGSDDGAGVVRQLVGHDRHEIRCMAVRVLGEVGSAADIPLLERLCQSRFLDVKFAAIGALARQGDLKRIDLLLAVLNNPDHPATTEGVSPKEVRKMAIQALADGGYTPALGSLQEVLAKGDLDERTAAAAAIVRIQAAKQSWRSRRLIAPEPAEPTTLPAPSTPQKTPQGGGAAKKTGTPAS